MNAIAAIVLGIYLIGVAWQGNATAFAKSIANRDLLIWLIAVAILLSIRRADKKIGNALAFMAALIFAFNNLDKIMSQLGALSDARTD